MPGDDEAMDVEPGLLARDAENRVSLMGARCAQCGAYSVRAQSVCPECWAEGAVQPLMLSRRGRVASSFVARTAPSGFVPPYTFALIDLPEGLRVLMRVDDSQGTVQIGTEVEVDEGELGRTESGVTIRGPVFRPVEEVG